MSLSTNRITKRTNDHILHSLILRSPILGTLILNKLFLFLTQIKTIWTEY